MFCHGIFPSLGFVIFLMASQGILGVSCARKNPVRRHHNHQHHVPVHVVQDTGNSHSMQYIPQVVGYNYPGPGNNQKPIIVRHERIVASGSAPTPNTVIPLEKPSTVTVTPTSFTSAYPKVSNGTTTMEQQLTTTFRVKATTEIQSTTTEALSSIATSMSSSSMEEVLMSNSDSDSSLETSAATQDEQEARLLLERKEMGMVQIKSIDVACGKERMTARITFDDRFNGVIYAKGHYQDPNCRFIGQNSGQKVYQFDMVVGQCGVSFVDAGLFSGGMAYVEGTLVAILEPGVQEAWDAARRIRCLWEGNIDQTVTFPIAINTLDSQTLTFSGDTATASLEIQAGRGPRAQPINGLVRIGELLTAVVTVQGDTEFDLVVRNCVATDGTPENRLILSDNMGCTTKPKLMGGWKKMKSTGNVAAYAYLTAFKFPDVMDLFLECTVSLCKGACEVCPDYLEVHVPGHDSKDSSTPNQNDISSKKNSSSNKTQASTRRRRNLEEMKRGQFNDSLPAESLRLRRVVHVVGPDDLPEVSGSSLRPTIYGGHCSEDCFSLFGVMCTVVASLLVVFATVSLCGVVRRSYREDKW